MPTITPNPRPEAVPVVVNVSGPDTVPVRPPGPLSHAKLPSGFEADDVNFSTPPGCVVKVLPDIGTKLGTTE